MKTEIIYYTKKNNNGIYIYNKNKNNMINNILKKYDFLYLCDNIEIQKDEYYNSNGNHFETTDIKLSEDEIKIHNIKYKEVDGEKYMIKQLTKDNEYIIDLHGLDKGIYNENVEIIKRKIYLKEYENLFHIAKEYNIDINTLYSLNKDFDEVESFFDNDKTIINEDNIKETEINIPLNINKFYIKKLNYNLEVLEQVIHTYIMLNGFNKQEFIELYNDTINKTRSLLSYKLYSLEELINLWDKVTANIRNKTDIHKKMLSNDLTTTKYLFNYDRIFSQIDKNISLKEKRKKINEIKNKLRNNNKKKINEKRVIKFVEKNPLNTISDVASFLKLSVSTIKKINNKFNLNLKYENTNNNKKILDTYEWFIMMNLKPSIDAIRENSKKRKSIENENDEIVDEYKYISIKTIRKVLKDKETYTNKQYEKSLEENRNKLSVDEVQPKKKNKEIDDDEFDFWSDEIDLNAEFLKEELYEEEKNKDSKEYIEFKEFMGEVIYKKRREEHNRQLKALENEIRKNLEKGLSSEEIDWETIDNNFLEKMGYTRKQVYDRITEESDKDTLRELEKINKEEEYFKSLNKPKSKIDKSLDDIFMDIDN